MRLGTARVNLNWPSGLLMAGYSARTAPSTGIRQPLCVRAIVASTQERVVCLLSIETVAVDAAFTTSLRDELANKFGILPEAIMVAATHTHSAPGGTARFPALGGSEAFMGKYAPERVRLMLDTCVETVGKANSSQVSVRLVVGAGHAEGVGLNRRDPKGPADASIPYVRAIDESGAMVALIYSFACHPTLLDARNTLYSGDLAGAAANRLESVHGGTVLPLTGAAGDISTRFTRRESSLAELDRLAGLLVDGLDSAESSDTSPGIAFASSPVTIPLKPAANRETLELLLADAQTRLEHAAPEQRRVIEAEVEGLGVALAAGPRPDTLATEVQVLRLGHTLIVGFPGEMFVEHGLALRKLLSPVHILLAGYANDYVGYVPTPYATHGYEGDSAIVAREAGQTLLDAAVHTARQCLAEPD